MPGTERTLVLVKPDGVQRQLVGRILARYEERGLKVVGLKLVRVDRDARRAALRGPSREAVLRRPRRLHHLGAAGRARPRRTERDRRRPGDQRRDPTARGCAGHDPRRLRARDGAEHRPRLGQPRGRRRPSSRCGSTRPSCSTTSATSTAGCSPRTTEDAGRPRQARRRGPSARARRDGRAHGGSGGDAVARGTRTGSPTRPGSRPPGPARPRPPAHRTRRPRWPAPAGRARPPSTPS